jgi:hypothetical protein
MQTEMEGRAGLWQVQETESDAQKNQIYANKIILQRKQKE